MGTQCLAPEAALLAGIQTAIVAVTPAARTAAGRQGPAAPAAPPPSPPPRHPPQGTAAGRFCGRCRPGPRPSRTAARNISEAHVRRGVSRRPQPSSGAGHTKCSWRPARSPHLRLCSGVGALGGGARLLLLLQRLLSQAGAHCRSRRGGARARGSHGAVARRRGTGAGAGACRALLPRRRQACVAAAHPLSVLVRVTPCVPSHRVASPGCRAAVEANGIHCVQHRGHEIFHLRTGQHERKEEG